MNTAYLPYTVFLGYQCVAPGLLFCFVTLSQTAESVVMKLSSGTSTSVGIAASYVADNM